MNRIDYSNFGRFCHCAFRALGDHSSPDYLLGKHCRNMSYEQMVAFYRRFKDAAQYICDLNNFVYHLKWFDQCGGADLTREAVLYQVMGSDPMIKDECVDELFSFYRADIDEFIQDIMTSEDNSCDSSWEGDCFSNDDLPF